MIESIRKTFIQETTNELVKIEQEMKSQKQGTPCPDLMELIHRTMHTIKGAGPMFGFNDLPEIAAPVEQALKKLIHPQVCLSHKVEAKIIDVVTLIKRMLTQTDNNYPKAYEKREAVIHFFNDLCQ